MIESVCVTASGRVLVLPFSFALIDRVLFVSDIFVIYLWCIFHYRLGWLFDSVRLDSGVTCFLLSIFLVCVITSLFLHIVFIIHIVFL